MTPHERRHAEHLLEESSIHWKRDWDAMFVGFAIGVLVATAVLLIALR